MSIVFSRLEAVFAGRNYNFRVQRPDNRREVVGVVRLVGENSFRTEAFEQRRTLADVGGFPARKKAAQRISQRVHRRVELGRQSAPGAPDRLRSVFF